MGNWCAFIVPLLIAASTLPAAETRYRQPVALAVRGDDVIVANRRSGTLSTLDARTAAVIDERAMGGMPSDLRLAPDGSILVTDESAGELLRIKRDGIERLRVPAYPVSVRISADGTFSTVAALGSRRLAVVELSGPMTVRRVVELPFAPREQVLTPDGRRAIVADAFGGNVAVVELATGAVASQRTLQAHNIRGLAFDARELFLSHQMLDARTPTESSRIAWGQVVGNVFRAVRASELFGAGETRQPIARWSLYPLGTNGRGAGDPGAVLVTASGWTAVALSGVNEVALRHSPLEPFQRIAVGRRPTALAASPDGSRLYVVNTFGESVSVVDLSAKPSPRVIQTISLGPRPELSERDLGEQLFYDARLSLDGWYSCHSCHPDGHTNAQRNDNASDGSTGTPKQIPSLLGVEETRPWGWNGRMITHEMQVQRSILGTMHGPPAGATADNVNAIASFIRSLPAPPSVAVARGEDVATDPAVLRGREIFEDLRCGRCHHVPEFTSERTYDVALPDEAGLTHFNPPSLLGVSQREAYLHDGRARTLEDVFSTFGHPSGKGTEGESVKDLAAYLRTL